MKETKDFENKLKRLEEIVSSLEKEEKSLDETVSLFQEGMKLSKECRKVLSTVEQSITKVVGGDVDGNPDTVPFKVEDE